MIPSPSPLAGGPLQVNLPHAIGKQIDEAIKRAAKGDGVIRHASWIRVQSQICPLVPLLAASILEGSGSESLWVVGPMGRHDVFDGAEKEIFSLMDRNAMHRFKEDPDAVKAVCDECDTVA